MERQEKDSSGVKDIPGSAYYGVQTARAAENFRITGQRLDIQLVYNMARIKKAAAYANEQAGNLDGKKRQAIVAAVVEICHGKLDEAFIVDAIQGGAGTSSNMNVNEVIANRALELLGHARGEYQFLHPLDDVNRSQSTNDVYPSAGKLTALHYLDELATALEYLILQLNYKARAFKNVKKMGRTQLQEAVPTTLGATFQAFASNLARCLKRMATAKSELVILNMGGTAIGNSVNADANYQAAFYTFLQRDYQEKLQPADDLIDATQNTDSFVIVSGTLKALAVSLSKIANDLRLLSSGPKSGFGEINLPAVQAGSSIMPGKINPVIPEVVNQIAFQVVGNDAAIALACEAGQLELNAFEPLIFHNLFASCQLLRQGCLTLANKCIVGITANVEKCHRDVAQSTGTITALTPLLGYEIAARIVKEALAKNISVFEILAAEHLLSAGKVEALKLKIS